MEVAVGKHAAGGDFAAIVYRVPVSDRQVGVGRHKRVQVDHRAALLPQETMQFRLNAVVRGANYLGSYVHPVGIATRVVSNGSEINDFAASPQDCMADFVAR